MWASDPGGFALRRATRGTLSFLLTLLVIWAAGTLADKPVMAMALGFPVSIFACVIVRENDVRTRLLATAGLVIAAAVAFSTSALITNAWVNHALFVALVFGVVYARRWGSRWAAAGFGAFVSFFFGAFLAPPPSGLPWHLLGLSLATGAALLVQFVILPHDAVAGLDRTIHAIHQRLALMLAVFERSDARSSDRDLKRLRSELHLLKSVIVTAREQLEATDGGWRTCTELSFHLFEVEAAAERLVWLEAQGGDGRDLAGVPIRASRLRAWLTDGSFTPIVLPPAQGSVADGLEELHDTVVRLYRSRTDGQSEGVSDVEQGPAARAPDRQHGLSPDLRLALQASVACALGVIGGELLSPHRWYWAVITVFVMFSKTSSRGDALLKSVERVAGTLAGVIAGVGLVWLVNGDWLFEMALLPAAIFLTFYFFVDRYSIMVFFLTIMLAVLYSLLDRFTPGILWLRLEETAVGATAGTLVSAFLLPRATRAHVRESFLDLMLATRGLVDVAVERLLKGHDRSLGAHSRDFDAAYVTMQDAIRPLWLDRFGGGAELQVTLREELQSCSYWVHELGLAGHGRRERRTGGTRQALVSQRDRLRCRLDQLRQRVSAGQSPSSDASDSGLALAGDGGTDDQGLDGTLRALRNIAASFDQVGKTVISGSHTIRFFRY